MNQLKKVIKVTVILFTVLLIAGCSNGQKEKAEGKKVVYGIYKAGDQTWFIDEGKAAEKKVKEMGGEFIYVDAKMNPEEYLKAIDNAVANQAAGVITCIPDQQLSQATINKLKAAEIPVVAVDDALQDDSGKKLAPWVGIDGYSIGKKNAEWMVDYMEENKLVDDSEAEILILTMDTVSSCVPRTDGMKDVLKGKIPNYPKEKINTADYNGETEKGFNAASAIITAKPKIKKWIILSANEEGAIGAVRAVEQAGLEEDSAVMGLGAYLAKDEFNSGKKAMKAATYFSSDSVGADSAEMLMNYIKDGKKMPEERAVDAVVVTPENYKEVMGKAAE